MLQTTGTRHLWHNSNALLKSVSHSVSHRQDIKCVHTISEYTVNEENFFHQTCYQSKANQ